MADPNREIAQFKDFAALLGFAIGDVANPNKPGHETGMDVVTTLNGRSIGAQLTDYHADEARTKGGRGSQLRIEEVRKAKAAKKRSGVQVYGTSAPGDYLASLVHRVSAKISKANTHSYSVEELWLLVSTQDPHFGATGATFIASDVISVSALDQHLGPLLSGSPFERAFVFLALERVVFGWSRGSNWQILKEKVVLDPARIEELRQLYFGPRRS